MVAHICDLKDSGRVRQEDYQEFQVSLTYTEMNRILVCFQLYLCCFAFITQVGLKKSLSQPPQERIQTHANTLV